MLLIARCKMLGCSRDEWADSFLPVKLLHNLQPYFFFFKLNLPCSFNFFFVKFVAFVVAFFFNEMHFCRFT